LEKNFAILGFLRSDPCVFDAKAEHKCIRHKSKKLDAPDNKFLGQANPASPTAMPWQERKRAGQDQPFES
jgi:hypothetical protein